MAESVGGDVETKSLADEVENESVGRDLQAKCVTGNAEAEYVAETAVIWRMNLSLMMQRMIVRVRHRT